MSDPTDHTREPADTPPDNHPGNHPGNHPDDFDSERDMDVHTLSGAYAVDAVDDLERQEFERHLATCDECREEVSGLRATATQLSLLMQATPPASLREQVLQNISAVRPLPPEVRREAGDRIEATHRSHAGLPESRTVVTPEPTEWGTSRAQRRETRSRRTNRWLAVAAAVVIVGGGGTAIAYHPWDRTSQTQVTLADRVIQAPDAQRYQQTLGDGSTIAVVRSKSVGQAVLQTTNLPAAPDGKTYQMWLQASGGNYVSAGLVPGSGSETVLLSGDAATAQGAGVSVEPTGGSSQPTTKPIALFSFA